MNLLGQGRHSPETAAGRAAPLAGQPELVKRRIGRIGPIGRIRIITACAPEEIPLASSGQAILDVLRCAMAAKPSSQIHDTAMSWSGVTSGPHRFGGTEYRLGKREIGHVHGDYLVDIPFPRKVRNDLVSAGLAEPHHILPDTGWVSFYIKQADQVDAAIALLRKSYDLASAARRTA